MGMLKEFRAFAMRGNVLDMAVGVIVGAALGKIVTSLVSDLLMPPLGLLTGGMDFSRLSLTLKAPLPGLDPVTLRYGVFINSVIDFVIVAFCVFLLVHQVNRWTRKPAPAATTKECPQCAMSIPINARKCPHCTSQIA
jgi:large conductance mechanosensitive channel